MPHLRQRYLAPLLSKDLKWSPAVSVLGMRQVGKTTLLRQIGATYLTLDDEPLRNRLETGDWSILESGDRPVIIDEAQKLPGIFDRVKLLVDRAPRPGQFVLTGSVRFLSKADIRESLTGRTSILELLPLSLRETHSEPLSQFVSEIHRSKPVRPVAESRVRQYLDHGGMPGICFKRDRAVRRQMHDAHLETLLLRDLQMLVRTRVPYLKLRSLLQQLAQTQGTPISFRDLARRVQISTPTAIQLVSAFVDLFLIKPHGKSFYLTDCGIASHLGASKIENPLFQMERWVYSELLAQLMYRHRGAFHFYPFSTRGGALVPFVVEIEGHPPLAIVVDASGGASEKSLKSLTALQRTRKGPIKCVVLHSGKTSYESSSGVSCIPYHWIA